MRNIVLLIFFFLAACGPVTTAAPTQWVAPAVEMTDTPTATVVWFPPTATFTLVPTPERTPTPDPRTNVAELLFQDDFGEPDAWTQQDSGNGTIVIAQNTMTMAVSREEGFLSSLRLTPQLGDFYLEIDAEPSLCGELDEYGLMFRVASELDHYRFSIDCGGHAKLLRFYQGGVAVLQERTAGSVLPPGPFETAHLGVWIQDDVMRFFVNENHIFSVQDRLLTGGTIGLFARAAGNTAVTVQFSNLRVWSLIP